VKDDEHELILKTNDAVLSGSESKLVVDTATADDKE
jgi:hypothetical protein